MKFPRFDLLVLPRTMEGYRGAFFGTFLSLFLDYFGVTSALIALAAFAFGIACAPHLAIRELDGLSDETTPPTKNTYPGVQKPLIDRSTFDRVQVLLGDQTYQTHELLYAGELIRCGHCGHPITGEVKQKQTKSGPKSYRYYRCTYYNVDGHPRHRVNETKLDQQVLAFFDQLKVKDEKVRDWFANALRARTRTQQEATADRASDLARQIASLRKRKTSS